MLAVAGLVFRFEILEPRGGDDIHRAHMVFWLFALGWAAATATSVRHRVLLSLVAVAAVPGFFDDPHRELLVLAGLLALFWVPAVRLPQVVARGVAGLAAASMWIYLLHWQVYPWFEDSLPWLATALGLGVGVAGWRACDLARSRWAARNN